MKWELASIPRRLRWSSRCYDGAIMMVRTQITLDRETQKRARRRASEMGVSFAEYVRRVISRDLALPEAKADVAAVFDLGASDGSDIARNKKSMVAEAFNTKSGKARIRRSA
jgi:hypothetical protein